MIIDARRGGLPSGRLLSLKPCISDSGERGSGFSLVPFILGMIVFFVIGVCNDPVLKGSSREWRSSFGGVYRLSKLAVSRWNVLSRLDASVILSVAQKVWVSDDGVGRGES